MQTGDVDNPNLKAAPAPVVRILLPVLLALAAVWLIYRTFELLLLVFGAMLVALLLSVTATELRKLSGLPYKWGVLLATILLLPFMGGLGWLFGHELITQIGDLGRKLPKAWESWSRSLSQNPMGKILVNSLQSRGTVVSITNEARSIAEGTVMTLFNLLIVIAGGVFFAATPRRYRHIFIALFPRPARPLAARTAKDVSNNLSYWLLTQFASMVIMGIIFTIGLHLTGVPAASALGVLRTERIHTLCRTDPRDDPGDRTGVCRARLPPRRSSHLSYRAYHPGEHHHASTDQPVCLRTPGHLHLPDPGGRIRIRHLWTLLRRPARDFLLHGVASPLPASPPRRPGCSHHQVTI